MMSSGRAARARAGFQGLLCAAALLSGALPWSWAASAAAAEASEGPAVVGADRAELSPLPSREELNRDPAATGLMLFDLLEQAAAAEKAGDIQSALRAYEAIARVVPERATAFSKLCELRRALGERDAAIAACYRATGLPGSKLADHLRYVELLLGKPPGEPFEPRELDELRATFAHLRKEGVTGPELEVLECQFAVVLEELDPLQRCVERLRATLPSESPFRFTYEMSLALLANDLDRASAILREARHAGMNGESLELMQAEIARRAATHGAPASAGSSALAGLVGVEEGPSAECPIGPGSTCPSPAQRGRGEFGTNLGHEVLVACGFAVAILAAAWFARRRRPSAA